MAPMSPKDFRRARSADAIEARRLALLTAARELLEDNDPSDVSLAAICGRAGLVKSAVYRYFESREDMLAEILLLDLKAFLEGLDVAVADIKPNDFHAAARIFAEMSAARPRMASLTAQMASIFERNISAERLLDVKLQMVALFGGFVGVVHKTLPVLGLQKAQKAAQLMHTQISALYPVSNPDETIAKVMEHPDLAVFKTDFQAELELACRAILLGLAAPEFDA